ncbi:uncharacterized protein LOC129789843 [Lutzomyia longipalpis]|uniref:uncharacterized protein LOC129789843 n=1 Tax=Lutzomyia longipalpis TaxID=7200 RepID=UPI002483F3DF|nr:uncharacterized protein LOC129789843 [Lutzomyia longipalpis]
MLIADSGAVKVITSQEILIGVGNHVKYVKSGCEAKVIEISTDFRGKILGIEILRKPDGIIALVYGGRYLAAFVVAGGSVRKLTGCEFSDQISSIHCEDDPGSICVITGHNLALLVKLEDDFSLTKKAKCEDNSTLYCSHVEGAKWEDFLVYSGTALGDVILWKPSQADTGILQRFTAHKGVVFSITTNEGLLVTTSDDRSAKIWQKEENHITSRSVALFGHKSRVFRSKILSKNNQKFILTIGEDSNLCVWHESGKFLFRKALYTGAVIWNLDYDPQSETVFTSGSDGNVKKLKLSEILRKGLNESPRKALLEEKISKILFIDCKTILILASEMFIMKQEASGEWKSSMRIPLPDIYISLIENVDGKVLICSSHEARILRVSENSIEEEGRNDNLLEGLIRTFYQISPGEFFFVDDRGNCGITDKSLKVQNQFSVSLCKDLWYTKWITVAKKIADFLLLGDRMGNLHLCRVSPGQIDMKSVVKSVHGTLGVTQIHLETISSDSATFWSSGRDGLLRMFLLDTERESMREIFTEKVPISWVEKIISRKNGRKLILGFNDENLIVWEKDEGVVVQLCTGGGHKYWDFMLNPTETSASILSVWDKKPFLDEFSLPDASGSFLDIPSANWHHKSCNSVGIIRESSGRVFLASGGDDNSLRINLLNEEEDLLPVCEVFTHISNIRAMEVINLQEEDEFLLISVGGRAQMCVTKILPRRKPQVQEFINFMLKSRDFGKNRLNQMIDFCPETRFMCLRITGMDVFVGCSDGFIRKFSLEKDKIRFISSVFYGRCILNVQIIENFGQKVLLTMGTDGKILFWDVEEFSEESLPFGSLQHHESGINCFDLLQEDGKIIILTGGDDQKIVKSVFRIDGKHVVQEEPTREASLHFAQVTGLKISSRAEFFSAGVDQRVLKGSLAELRILQEKFTSVSDLKGLELLNKQDVLVYGAGIELIKF